MRLLNISSPLLMIHSCGRPAVGPLSLLHCLFSLFNSLFTPFLPQQCSPYRTVPTSPYSVYTPLSPCHHSYISCQVELASFSPSCCSTAKNKAPLCRNCHEAPVWCSVGLKTPLSDKQKQTQLSDCSSSTVLI